MFFGAFWATATLVIILIGMEETMFFRSTIKGVVPHGSVEIRHEMVEDSAANGKPLAETSTKSLTRYRLFTPSSNPPSVKRLFSTMWVRLVMIFQFPNLAWAGFIYGINLSWYLMMIGTASPILSAPPYNWSPALVGCIYTGPIIGAIFGCLYSGFFADKFVLRLARKNGGIRELEQRLWPLAVAGLATAFGLVLWGVGSARGIHWIGLVFGLGIMVFGVVVGGSIGVSYAVDCFKDISGISIASVMVVRNVIGFSFSYAFTPWVNNMGT
ncbi:hypothetical protein E4T42_02219 [Aureobasidium subglaciale]|nr:hypothetical protein E4T42_02219 [Aureobasidium subglaciale]